MITQDLQLVKQIFELLDAGIVEGYDSFCYEVVVSVGYMETVLTVEKEGVRVTDAETDYNGAILYRLVKELRECATRRGETWNSFVMTYTRGGEVKTKFNV
ncbi:MULTISPECIES: hypothetical protein [Pseudomonas]|uniref:hypothetical protein n=1 Tax=Pseudomonas TaxID=286 RepID=UPI000E6D3BA5|nr:MULTISPECIES: hypothetical protein [unclassified Pseudomonas]MBT0625440.1 hypothetical protein [Pseudomonas fluorescens]QJI11160.1 hypothetical protein HKK58_00975 [Pseudomonas sp. ADAK22]